MTYNIFAPNARANARAAAPNARTYHPSNPYAMSALSRWLRRRNGARNAHAAASAARAVSNAQRLPNVPNAQRNAR